MANANVPMASALLKYQNIVDLLETTRQYLSDIEPKDVMPYMVDVCNESLLPFLAVQFNVSGIKGYDLAITVKGKRELIKQSIAINAIKGSVASMREALKSIGYSVITITEGRTGNNFYDGEYIHDGTITYGSGSDNWAYFSVEVDLLGKGIDSDTIVKIKELIGIHKPARCILQNLTFAQTLTEKVYVFEDFQQDIV